jgi:hypothetical protein
VITTISFDVLDLVAYFLSRVIKQNKNAKLTKDKHVLFIFRISRSECKQFVKQIDIQSSNKNVVA